LALRFSPSGLYRNGLNGVRRFDPTQRKRVSEFHPYLISPHLALESVHPLAPNCCAPPVGQPESPTVQRADHLTLVEPAMPERTAGMRAASRQGDNVGTYPENSDPQSQGVERAARSILDLVEPTHRDPLCHGTMPRWKLRKSANEKPRTCVRG